MSGFFRRKRSSAQEDAIEDQDEKYLDLIACKVNDSDGNYFGEVVSADPDTFIIKHKGAFYSMAAESVGNKFGDLMLGSNIDLSKAKKEGEQWQDQGKDVIGENKFYDFSEKRQLEQERNDRILNEMEMARELALKTMPSEPVPHTESDSENEPESENEADPELDDEDPVSDNPDEEEISDGMTDGTDPDADPSSDDQGADEDDPDSKE
jgi:hypothetical protein